MVSGKRIYKWDNLKAILILLAVVGHFLAEVSEDSTTMQGLYFYIYIFHMPLFVYMSGMFAWHSVQDPQKRRTRVIGFLILGLLVKCLILVTKIALGLWDPGDFSILKTADVSWYLFALAVFIEVTWLCRDMNQRFLLGLSVLMALFVGYDTTINNTLTLSRCFVFYPFFLMGYHTNPFSTQWKKLEEPWIRLLSALVLVLVLILVLLNIGTLVDYQDLLLGWKSYKQLPEPEMGFWLRLLTYAGTMVTGLAVISLTPRRRTGFSYVGRRTLPIYFWHRPFAYLISTETGLAILSHIWPSHWRFLAVLLAVPVTWMLSQNLFDRPFDWFWRMMDTTTGRGEDR